MLFDRGAIDTAEGIGVAQKTRHKEIEQGPQFAQMIFQRRAGQTQSMVGVQLAQHLGGLGARVFDVLGLVENDAVKLDGGQSFGIPWQQRIGGQQ